MAFGVSDASCQILIESGYAVKQCFDGDEAFNAAYEGIYDLWLLDVSVPGIDGFSLLKRAKSERQKYARDIYHLSPKSKRRKNRLWRGRTTISKSLLR